MKLDLNTNRYGHQIEYKVFNLWSTLGSVNRKWRRTGDKFESFHLTISTCEATMETATWSKEPQK